MQIRKQKMRFICAGVAALFLATGAFYVTTVRATADGPGSDLYYQGTEEEFAREGQVPFSGRPAVVQVVFQRMYANNGHYHSFSGLFVSQEPGGFHGSQWVNITQPSYIRTQAFASLTGTGAVIEETQGQGGNTTIYAPSANAYTENSHPASTKLPPLESVPLSVVEVDYGPTNVDGMIALQSVLANAMLHPACLVTSPFFTNKQITLEDQTSFGNRPAWVLHGTQIAGTPVATDLGDSWRMWVDKASGIILRIEYYSGSTMIGWAEFQNVSIDGSGSEHQIPPLQLPGSAQRLDPDAYGNRVATPALRALAAQRNQRSSH